MTLRFHLVGAQAGSRIPASSPVAFISIAADWPASVWPQADQHRSHGYREGYGRLISPLGRGTKVLATAPDLSVRDRSATGGPARPRDRHWITRWSAQRAARPQQATPR